MGTYYAVQGGSRILNASRVDQSGADDADVVDWALADNFILACNINSGGKNTAAAQYKLRWQISGGAFADVASTGAIKFGSTNLVNGATIAVGGRKCDSYGSDTWQTGYEVEGTALSTSIDLADEYETEIHFSLSCADAAEGALYEFELYDATKGETRGTCGATLTTLADTTPPTVVLDTDEAYDFGAETKPALLFTGTDVGSPPKDITYQLQIDTVDTFDSGSDPATVIVDSYVEGNTDYSGYGLYSGASTKWGQSFTALGGTLETCKFYVYKEGSPTGNVTAELWAHTGEFGVNGTPTGLVLATSDTLDITTIGGVLETITLTFSGAERISLANGVHYFILLCFSGGSSSNSLHFAIDSTSPTHPGNRVSWSTSWTASNNLDMIFYVYCSGTTGALLDKLSDTDAGFTRSGDSDPFTSAQQVTYTVQTGEELTTDTYYWRVRGYDIGGSETWGAYPATKSFIVNTAGGNKEVLPSLGALLLTGFAATVFATNPINISPSLGQVALAGYAPTVTTSNNISVSPSLGQLTINGYAPDVTATVNQSVSIGLGELLLTGYAPTADLSDNKDITTDVGVLTLIGFAPTVFAQDLIEVNPSLGELTLTGFEPTASVSDNKNIDIDVGVLSLTGYEPTTTATDHQDITIGLGELALTGFEPVISTSDHKNITTDLGELVLTGFAPTLIAADNKEITPSLGELTLEGFNPTASVSDNKNIQLDVGSLILAGFSPVISVSDNTDIVADVGSLTLVGYEPTIFASNLIEITTDVGSLTLTGFVPTLTVGDAKNINTGLGELTLTGIAPTIAVTANQNIVTDLGVLTFTGYNPTLGLGDAQTVYPELGEIVLAGFAPIVSTSDHKDITIDLGELTLLGYEPIVFASDVKNISIGLGEVVLTGFAPTIGAVSDTEITPSVGELTLTGYVPTIALSDNKNIAISLGEVLLTGFEPTIAVGDAINIVTDTGIITLTGYAPTLAVSNHINISTDTGVISLEGFAPSVSLSANIVVNPSTGEIVLAGYVPTVTKTEHKNILPSTGALVFSGYAPGVVATTDDWRNPSSLTETVGAIVSGTLADVYIDSDATELVLSETVGTPGFDYTFEFGIGTDVPSTLLHLYVEGYYDGNVAHNVKLQQWNYDTSAWTDVSGAIFPDAGAEQNYKFRLINDPDYISSGNIKLRVVHTSAGNPVHQLHLDKFYVDLTDDKEAEPSTGELVITGYAPNIRKTVPMFYWDSASWVEIGTVGISILS